MPVQLSVRRLSPVEEEIDLSKSSSFNAAAWIKISEPYHILEPRERKKLTATITVPEDAEPGGHYATVVLQLLQPASVQRQTSAEIAPQVGILAFITTPGDVVRELHAEPPITGRLHDSAVVPITAGFQNTGTINLLPTGKVTVKNLFGFTSAELPLQPRIVLPNTVKEFTLQWQDAPWFGIYSIQTQATYGPDQVELASPRRFFVVVQWLPLLFVVPLLIGAVWFMLKTYRRWPQAYRAFRVGSQAKSARTRVSKSDTKQKHTKGLDKPE